MTPSFDVSYALHESMAFSLPKLNYSYKDLEPYINRETMEIHYTKHHSGYVDKLNATLNGLNEYSNMTIEEILKEIDHVPNKIKQDVINNGGGHINHTLYWKTLSPQKQKPSNSLSTAINSTFGNFDNFVEKFSEKAMGLFGSGWVFLIIQKDKTLALKRHSFQNSPYMNGNIPILGLDLWEHAYYLNYQNRKKDYVEAWWNIINWQEVSNLFDSNT